MNAGLNWETLNAYVDGELSASEAARVADAVAQDPELARQVSLLTSLKASVAGSVPRFDLLPIDNPSPRRPRRLIYATAATVLALGVLVGVMIANSGLMSPRSGIGLAESVHTEWLHTLERKQGSEAAHLLKSNLDTLRLDAYVPDLTQVQLAFDGVRAVRARGGDGLHVGYLGPHGCQVSLVIFPGHGGLAASLHRQVRSGLPVFSWTTGESNFHLLAYGMDPVRFEQVAGVVYRLTRNRLPLDPEAILALHKARAEGRPCSA